MGQELRQVTSPLQAADSDSLNGYPEARLMSESLDVRRKRLIYRASHTGRKETDLLLGGFAKKHLSNFDAAELDRFEILLDIDDNRLLAWVMGREEVPEAFDSDVMKLLQNFNYF
jgi:succinate dehydrogenase flavin-adding protein (antitoxin of CptAB toxin-antitoxin module)